MELETLGFKFHSLLFGEIKKEWNLKPSGFKFHPKPWNLIPLIYEGDENDPWGVLLSSSSTTPRQPPLPPFPCFFLPVPTSPFPRRFPMLGFAVSGHHQQHRRRPHLTTEPFVGSFDHHKPPLLGSPSSVPVSLPSSRPRQRHSHTSPPSTVLPPVTGRGGEGDRYGEEEERQAEARRAWRRRGRTEISRFQKLF